MTKLGKIVTQFSKKIKVWIIESGTQGLNAKLKLYNYIRNKEIFQMQLVISKFLFQIWVIQSFYRAHRVYWVYPKGTVMLIV